MKNPLSSIIFLIVAYALTYMCIYIIQFTYDAFNFWVSFVTNLALLMLVVYLIDIFVKKIDNNDD